MFCNVFRLGRDAELRFTQNGDAVASIALAYEFGYSKNKGTQWIEAAVFGKTAEALALYLTKGKQIYAELDDLRNEEYQGKTRMKARAVKITLIGSKSEQSEEPRKQKSNGIVPAADLNEDVPF
jgi:single-strand DNA-binding protein